MDPLLPVFTLATLSALWASWAYGSEPWARLTVSLARKAAGLRSRTIEVGGDRWHYLEGGRGPLLLMVHGFGGDADHFTPIAALLRRQFSLLIPDLPGFGSSTWREPCDWSVTGQCAGLEAFVSKVGRSPDFIVGSSMGGWVATRFATRMADPPRAVWLLAPLGIASAPTTPYMIAAISDPGGPLGITSRRHFEQRVIQKMFCRPPRWPRPLFNAYAKRAIRRSELSRRQLPMVLNSQPCLEELVAKSPFPILLHWGTEDQVLSPAGLEILQTAGRQVQGRPLSTTGHLPMLESPHRVYRDFIAFSRSLG